MSKSRTLARRIALAGFSLVLSLAVVETMLRIFRPDLGNVVDSGLQTNRYRIHANPRSTRRAYRHPERGRGRHFLIHNALGLRQHREFRLRKPDGVTRIGFFGDSFTENRRIPAAYSFTEPLDHLLNRTGRSFEVLNFGTDGYGTDQVYLQYLDEGSHLGLDVVVYVFCRNDLLDIVNDRLFEVDATGGLRYLPVRKSSPLVPFAKRLYLTYFLMESSSIVDARLKAVLDGHWDPDTVVDVQEEKAMQRSPERRNPSDRMEARARGLTIFRALIRQFRKDTAERGQHFLVALLPFHHQDAEILPVLREEGIVAVDLHPFFEAEGVKPREALFERDPHWNEEGNKLAAVAFFRALTETLGVQPLGEASTRRALAEYYGAFGSTPLAARWLAPDVVPDEETARRIRARYVPLEDEAVSMAAGGR